MPWTLHSLHLFFHFSSSQNTFHKYLKCPWPSFSSLACARPSPLNLIWQSAASRSSYGIHGLHVIQVHCYFGSGCMMIGHVWLTHSFLILFQHTLPMIIYLYLSLCTPLRRPCAKQKKRGWVSRLEDNSQQWLSVWMWVVWGMLMLCLWHKS